MSKELNKAIMTRSRLRNRYLNEKSADSKIAYDKQRNYCVNLLRRTKKKYFANINISSTTDNKKFWKTVKPLFSDKIFHKETITLAVNDTILGDDQIVADTFNNYFNNIDKNLLTVTNKNYPKEIANSVSLNLLDPAEAAILKLKNHLSLNAIRGKMSKLDYPNFYFEYTSCDQTLKELEKLDPKKTSQMNDIPVKVIKGNKYIVAFFIHHNFNNSLSSSTIFRRFYNNNLISNAEKSHLIVSTKKNLEIQVSSCSIRNEDSVKFLGVHLNNDLHFDYYVNQLCKKASKKLHALARIAKYMELISEECS